MRRYVLATIMVGAWVVGCGSDSDAAGGSAGGGGVPAACPATQPEEGSPCDASAIAEPCGYGDSVLPGCRTLLACSNGVFKSISISYLPCPNTACSADVQPGGSCDPDTAVSCHKEQASSCHCAECKPYTGGPCDPLPVPEWRCEQPSSPSGCPAVVPNSGTPCSEQGTSCTYQSCLFQVRCQDGVWSWGMLAC